MSQWSGAGVELRVYKYLLLAFVACITVTSAEVIRQISFNEMLRFHRNSGGIDTSVFVDALPIPPTIRVNGRTKQIQMIAREGRNVFYRDLPATKVWGFNGVNPGPTIEVESGQDLEVLWKSELPKEHLIPLDSHFMAGMRNSGPGALPAVRTVTHLHGARVQDSITAQDRFHNNDGWPDAWIVPGQTQIAHYPNQQSARTLWYHDHAMGATSRNVVAGLLGLYIIRDNVERSLHLPSGNFEIPLIFETKDFNDDGSLTYPSRMTAEVYGGTVPVNGKICPFLNVEPRKYRFRMLDAATARSFAFKLINAEDQSDGPAMIQIGSDGGFLERPLLLNAPNRADSPRLVLAPAERADVIVDFSHFAGKTLLLQNNFQSVAGEGELSIPNIMIFKVGARVSSPDLSRIPAILTPVPRLAETSAVKTRKIVLSQVLTPNLPPVMMLNEKVWGDPIEESPRANTTEIWEIINTLPDSHPFHMHLVQFQVLDRSMFDVPYYEQTKMIKYISAPGLPEPSEFGWKDTVVAYPNTVTRIIMQFGPYTGRYAFHCHILEHEDMGMMRPFEVIK